MKITREYYPGLDWLRFLMCLFIATYHYVVVMPSDNDFSKFVTNSGFYATSTFFVLSGFILTHVYRDKIITYQLDKPAFIKNRLVSLVPLHYLFQGVFLGLLIAHFFLKGEVPQSYAQYSSSDIFLYYIRSLFLLHAWDQMLLLNQPSWSLSALLFFYICFINMRFLHVAKSPVFLFFIFWGLYMLPALYYVFDDTSFVSYRALHINPLFRVSEFICGILAYSILLKYYGFIKRNALPLFLIGVFGVFVTYLFVFNFPELKPLFDNGAVIVFQVSLIYGCVFIFKSFGVSKLLGDMAIVIFLSHSLVLNVTDLVLVGTNYYMALILNLLIILILSYFILMFFVRPIRSYIREGKF